MSPRRTGIGSGFEPGLDVETPVANVTADAVAGRTVADMAPPVDRCDRDAEEIGDLVDRQEPTRVVAFDCRKRLRNTEFLSVRCLADHPNLPRFGHIDCAVASSRTRRGAAYGRQSAIIDDRRWTSLLTKAREYPLADHSPPVNLKLVEIEPPNGTMAHETRDVRRHT